MNETKPNNDQPWSLHKWLEEVYFDPERDAEFTRQDIIRVGDLVSKMLKFEPSSRAQVKEILADPWFRC